MTATKYSALTEYEFDGLSAKYGFADGHAYHDLDESQMAIVDRMPEIWMAAARQRQRDIERAFSYAFYDLAGQHSYASHDNFRICTSASQSIDLACAWAARAGKRIALIEPTFDNLALIVRRWGVPLQPIPEAAFPDGLDDIDSDGFDALFLVNPNNPTGRVIDIDGFRRIVDWCVVRRKTLLLDFCFRFFSPCSGDYYRALEESGVDFVAIEDTGKTWPTLDMKASLIAYSGSLKPAIERSFHEIFLGVSPFALVVLTEFINDTRARGLETTLWKLVAENRRMFRQAIDRTILHVDADAQQSGLGLEWLRIDHPRLDDHELTEHLKEAGVACLPGRLFHWSIKSDGGQRNVRFSLMKPRVTLEQGLPRLTRALDKARVLKGAVSS